MDYREFAATQKSAYQSADVKNIAGELGRHDGPSVKADDVDESVVSLPSAADADALFAKSSAQWTACDGKTLTVLSGTFVQNAITDVRVADSVVAATVSLGPGVHSILASIPEARAIGVRGNCLVEVEVSFFRYHLAIRPGVGRHQHQRHRHRGRDDRQGRRAALTLRFTWERWRAGSPRCCRLPPRPG
jgi:hypothetical protein